AGDEPRGTGDDAGAVLAHRAGRADLAIGALAALATTRRRPAVVAVGVRIDARPVALDEAGLARDVARPDIAQLARPPGVARAALTVDVAHLGRTAVRTVRVGIDADAVAVDERIGARQLAVAVVAHVAGAAGDPGAALTIGATARGGAAVASVALPVDADAIAVDQPALARQRAGSVVANVTGVTRLTRIASVEPTALGGPAVASVGVGIDAGVAAADQAVGARKRAHPIGA